MIPLVGALGHRLRRSLSVAWMLAAREWLADYRQSRFSALWPLVHPLAYSTLFVLLRPILGGASSYDVAPFGVFVFIGFCLWQTWFEVLRAQMESLRRHKGLMSRGEMGAATLMMSTTFAGLIQLVPRLLLATVLGAAVLGAGPMEIAGLVGYSLVVLGNGAAIGALLQPFSTLSADFGKAIQSISLGLLITGAVFIPISINSPEIVRLLLAANPMGSLLNAARAPLFGDALINPAATVGWTIVTLAVIAILPVFGRRVLPIVIERMGS